MKEIKKQNARLLVDFQAGCVCSLSWNDRELLAAHPLPLFTIRLRKLDGNTKTINAFEATQCHEIENGAIYSGFSENLRVYLTGTPMIISHNGILP